jgi:L-fuculose-phosphate aldolase
MEELNLYKEQIITACRNLDRRQFVANHDGNISIRLSDDEFLVTPTARAKGSLQSSDLLTVNFEGKTLSANGKIFSEWIWHQAIYLEYPEVTSVCHAHPPYATAMALAEDFPEYPSIAEAVVSLGAPIRSTGWVLSAKPSMADVRVLIRECLETSFAFVIPGNGVFAVGDDAEMSYLRVELLEQVARAHHLAQQLGPVKRLPQLLIQELNSRRPALRPKWKRSSEISLSQEIDEQALLEKVTEILKGSIHC